MQTAEHIHERSDRAADPAQRTVRILVVDDSAVTRRLMTRVLSQDPAFEIVGQAVDGAGALAQQALLQPDVITMDIEMPVMDGLTAVRQLRARGCTAIIIMCSGLTSHGAASTIEALMAGANDYVTKNAGRAAEAGEEMSAELIPRIKQFLLPRGGHAAPSAGPARDWNLSAKGFAAGGR